MWPRLDGGCAMQQPANDNWWRNRSLVWWQSLIIGVLLGPVVVLFFYRFFH